MTTKNWSAEYKLQVFTDLLPEFVAQFELAAGVTAAPKLEISHISKYEAEAKSLIANPGQIRGLATGYSQLDKRLGGLDKGELIIISGATGTGKTMLAVNLLLQAYQNPVQSFSTLVFSMEMTKPQLTARVHQVMNDSPYKNETNALPIYFYDSNQEPNLATMRAAFQTCKADYGLDVVVIDHLHYFAHSTENQANEIGALVRGIKLLALEFSIPILLLAHLRKRSPTESRNKMPDLDDLRDSSFIAQDADIVILLKRDLIDIDNNQNLSLLIAKNRNKGSVGLAYMRIRPSSFRLEEIEEPQPVEPEIPSWV